VTVRIKPLHGVPRKVWQVIHIVSAVGWLGIELCVLGLTVIGLGTDDAGTVRLAYDAAALLAETFFLPATVLMVLSGVVLGLGTRWGLVMYYWVAVKLAIGIALLVAGTITLEATLREVSGLAAESALTDGEAISLIGMLSVIALLTLVSAVLSVFKPWGRIPWRSTAARTTRIQTQES
jgi:hypothetical protein